MPDQRRAFPLAFRPDFRLDPEQTIARPRQICTGHARRDLKVAATAKATAAVK